MKFIRLSLAATIAFAPLANAQRATTDPRRALTEAQFALTQAQFVVKTVPLHHLTSQEAVKLLSPYTQTPGGGVYDVSSNIRAVTIREVPKVYSEMMTVLSQYDREPASVTLNFQLVAAENGPTRDPSVAALDSLLRSVLKFSGYRLLSTSVATASENGRISQTLSAGGEPLTLEVYLTDLRIEGNDASVHLNVSLGKPAIPATAQTAGQVPSQILSTGVTVPIGQTVVLGTSASDGGQRALILTVRPQLAKP
jgi:hypothetical protein